VDTAIRPLLHRDGQLILRSSPPLPRLARLAVPPLPAAGEVDLLRLPLRPDLLLRLRAKEALAPVPARGVCGRERVECAGRALALGGKGGWAVELGEGGTRDREEQGRRGVKGKGASSGAGGGYGEAGCGGRFVGRRCRRSRPGRAEGGGVAVVELKVVQVEVGKEGKAA
jgi:hypothetical protein